LCYNNHKTYGEGKAIINPNPRLIDIKGILICVPNTSAEKKTPTAEKISELTQHCRNFAITKDRYKTSSMQALKQACNYENDSETQ
jgi:hypothetical protein